MDRESIGTRLELHELLKECGSLLVDPLERRLRTIHPLGRLPEPRLDDVTLGDEHAERLAGIEELSQLCEGRAGGAAARGARLGAPRLLLPRLARLHKRTELGHLVAKFRKRTR